RQGHLVALTIDEYLTSQVIYANMKLRESMMLKPLGLPRFTADGVSHHSILVCNHCHILWQRDINAAKNMYGIAMAMWTDGRRPNELARPQQEIAAQNAVSL
ncbi:hypothetical protein BGW37DRAFT_483290, partial [Umbelopsis sp. PMI_123]